MTEAVADRRLHPATLIGRTLRAVPQAAGGMAVYGALIARADFGRVMLLILLGLMAAGAIAFLTWWRFRYGVGAREMVIESGVISRTRRVIPFERVQDIAIERPLLARLFGTAHVRIETGGAAADEGHLDSIALADALALRDVVRGRRDPHAAGEEAGEEAEPLLFAMGVGRVLLSGLFNFSLVFVAGLFAVLQNAEEIGLVSAKALPPPIEQAIGRGWLLASLVLALVVLLLGMIAGVLRTLARDFGFRLTRAAAGLRRRRGLFTLSETVIPLKRMQAARIESGLLARALGWHRFDLQTLGADPRERGAQVAAPFARMEEIAPILSETGFPAPQGPWLRAPRRAIVRRGLMPLLGAAAATAATFAWLPAAGIVAGLLLLLGLAAPLRWSRRLHAFGGEALFVADGVMKRRLLIVPYGRIQALDIERTPLQRLLGLATVAVDTAGAPALRGAAIADLDAGEAQAALKRLLALFKTARRPSRTLGLPAGTWARRTR